METKSKFDQHIDTWLSLNNEGRFHDGRQYYYSELFNDVIHRFIEQKQGAEEHQNGVLFSILGFTPEPIILTQRVLNPSVHIIFTTNKKGEVNDDINNCLEKFLTSDYQLVTLEDDNFFTIYNALKDYMILYPALDYTIDITGGKKSMVATAAIFGRDYNCNITYLDYDEYLAELRRPKPGTEKLKWVYRPNKDLPEIDFFKSQK